MQSETRNSETDLNDSDQAARTLSRIRLLSPDCSTPAASWTAALGFCPGALQCSAGALCPRYRDQYNARSCKLQPANQGPSRRRPSAAEYTRLHIQPRACGATFHGWTLLPMLPSRLMVRTRSPGLPCQSACFQAVDCLKPAVGAGEKETPVDLVVRQQGCQQASRSLPKLCSGEQLVLSCQTRSEGAAAFRHLVLLPLSCGLLLSSLANRILKG